MDSPRTISTELEYRAENLCEHAQRSLAQGDPVGASGYAREALALNRDCFSAHTLLAHVELRGEHCLRLLAKIHKHLRPRTYLEIGVAHGDSLTLVGKSTLAIGIDPRPTITEPLRRSVRVIRETSDGFFAHYDLKTEFSGKPLDLAFIDGMHQFEYSLRDFVNIERYSSPNTTVLIHDCYPLDAATSARDRTTTFWSGDVWKMILCLKKYRPDLRVHTLAAPPTGLGIVRGLDRRSNVLQANLEEIYREFVPLPYSAIESDKPGHFNLVPGDWKAASRLLG